MNNNKKEHDSLLITKNTLENLKKKYKVCMANLLKYYN